MKLSYFFTAIIVFSITTLQAQNWMPVGTGIKLEEKSEKELMEKPSIQDDGQEMKSNGTVNALVVYKGELYAGGIFKIAGGKKVSNIAKWNGKDWSSVGTGIDGNVTSFCVYKDELYVGGVFNTAGEARTSNIARWNGEKWLEVGGGTDSDIQALAVYKDELYAGGDFTKAGSVAAKHIAKWNGTAWAALGHGLHNDVFSLIAFEGELHAGGSFVVKDGEVVNNLFKWNGKRWAGEGDFNGTVAALAAHNGKLIAGGHYGKVNDEQLSFVAVHNDKIWQKVGEGIGSHTPQHHVSALYSSGNVLFAGGAFKSYLNDDHREANNLAQWDGTKWTNLGKGVNNAVYSMVVYNGELYVGGSFSLVNGEIASNAIARWKITP